MCAKKSKKGIVRILYELKFINSGPHIHQLSIGFADVSARMLYYEPTSLAKEDKHVAADLFITKKSAHIRKYFVSERS